MKRLILVGLNELNFEIISKYAKKYPGKYKYLEKLLELNLEELETEDEYKNLEPWIQWYSIHTGKKYDEHKVFRLGDAQHAEHEQIYEALEKKGFKVGAVSPMNAKNNLNNPLYFIPDPWTETSSDGTFFSTIYHKAISQSVNDNSKGNLSLQTIFSILLCFVLFSNKKRFLHYLGLAVGSITKRWKKALFLDLLTNDMHVDLVKRKKPNFSEVFLNSGAHIQHHYLRNSEFLKGKEEYKNPDWYVNQDVDPFTDILDSFNLIAKDYLAMQEYEVIFCTGLTQKPIKPSFYYRLTDHKNFLEKLGLTNFKVIPRMTRDFVVYPDNPTDLDFMVNRFEKVIDSRGKRMFADIDKRTDSIFVTLTYDNEIKQDTSFYIDETKIFPFNDIVFVAIKNGQHDPRCFVMKTDKIDNMFEVKNKNITYINEVINAYFQKI